MTLALSEEEPELAARKLIETAFSRGSADNITCIVVRLYHHQSPPPTIEPQIQTDDTQTQTEIQIQTQTQTQNENENETKTGPIDG